MAPVALSRGDKVKAARNIRASQGLVRKGTKGVVTSSSGVLGYAVTFRVGLLHRVSARVPVSAVKRRIM